MTARTAPGRSASFNAVARAAVLLGAALAAWIVTVARMRGMDAGPGTDLGGLGWYLGIWVTMMAAMMLPSVAPMVLLFANVSHEREILRIRHLPTWTFVAAYFAVWTVVGLGGYALYRLIISLDLGFLAWRHAGAYVAGAAIVAAGLYELTPLKRACLGHCRMPLHFIATGWRSGNRGALRMGAEHGAYCVGCCWGLMVILFALGVMSLLWMALVATVIFAEKVLPGGHRLAVPFAVAFIVLGLVVAAAPGHVPGLKQPDGAPAMHM